ncbi:hypothetical protein ACIP93_28660 [Streptomyces sp. NPDC088745]|uniref:hypothetical protein n=1 Tax=Streptomyces sp. NPDC088745 TaxID=3365884 RepID=UPI0037FA4FAA
MPLPSRTVLRRVLVALLAFTAVCALLVGAEPGTDGAVAGADARSAGVLPGPGPAEGEGVPDGSADPELRLLPGGGRRVQPPPAPGRARLRNGPPTRRARTSPARPPRAFPARGSAPHAARWAVLRC